MNTPPIETVEALARSIADCAAMLQRPTLPLDDTLMYSLLLARQLERLKEITL